MSDQRQGGLGDGEAKALTALVEALDGDALRRALLEVLRDERLTGALIALKDSPEAGGGGLEPSLRTSAAMKRALPGALLGDLLEAFARYEAPRRAQILMVLKSGGRTERFLNLVRLAKNG